MELFHTCDKRVLLEVSGISLVSPAITIGEAGIRPSILEINSVTKALVSRFLCPSCSKNVEISELKTHCSLCGKMHSVNNIYMSQYFGIICDMCVKMVRGEIERTPRIVSIVGYYPSDVGNVSTKLSKILSKLE